MTREEAQEVMEWYEATREMSCSCHLNPPCSKCEGGFSEEQVQEAKAILEAEVA